MTPDRRPRREVWIALAENLKIAVEALRANKLRTVLTVLGNVVAVMSVIAVVAIIDGMNTYVSEKILEQGLRVIYIDKFGAHHRRGRIPRGDKAPDLTTLEADALTRPDGARRSGGGAGRGQQERPRRPGRSSECPRPRHHRRLPGRRHYTRPRRPALEEADMSRRRPVCVIGSEIAEGLFPRVDPIGETVRVAGHELRVVGIVTARGSVLGQSQDNIVIVPLGQFQKMFGGQRSLNILVSAAPGSTSIASPTRPAWCSARSATCRWASRTTSRSPPPRRTWRSIRTLTGGIFAGTIGLVGDLAGGRRNRHHEHHARGRHRANPRDRHPQGGRSPPAPTSSLSS